MAESKKHSYLGRALVGEFEPNYGVVEAHIDLEEVLGDMINVSLSLSQVVAFLVSKVSMEEEDVGRLTTIAEEHQKSMEDLRKSLLKVVTAARENDNGSD